MISKLIAFYPPIQPLIHTIFGSKKATGESYQQTERLEKQHQQNIPSPHRNPHYPIIDPGTHKSEGYFHQKHSPGTLCFSNHSLEVIRSLLMNTGKFLDLVSLHDGK
ncbi:hypothetical protein NPIL_645141 [Nephila pilipes]|uniref:Uncharacterized protein n=1 Tax=Nephila pilipes TaxID=299642 RepID=A0A8X6IGL0_NEPPI|nr:hypothetical protein NPIL_645141 [Nephila pilipes]